MRAKNINAVRARKLSDETNRGVRANFIEYFERHIKLQAKMGEYQAFFDLSGYSTDNQYKILDAIDDRGFDVEWKPENAVCIVSWDNGATRTENNSQLVIEGV